MTFPAPKLLPEVKVGDAFESLVNHERYRVTKKGRAVVTVENVRLGTALTTTEQSLLDGNRYRRVP